MLLSVVWTMVVVVVVAVPLVYVFMLYFLARSHPPPNCRRNFLPLL